MRSIKLNSLALLCAVSLLGVSACEKKVAEEEEPEESVSESEVMERGKLQDAIAKQKALAQQRQQNRQDNRAERQENQQETFKDCGVSLSNECKAARRENRQEARGNRQANRWEAAGAFALNAQENNILEALRNLDWNPGCGGVGAALTWTNKVKNPGRLVGEDVMVLDAVADKFDDFLNAALANDDEDAGTVAQRGFDTLELVLEDDSLALCLLDFAAEKLPDGKLDSARDDLVNRFEVFGNKLRDKATARLREKIAERLENLLTGKDDSSDLLTEDELKAVANDVLVENLMLYLGKATTQVTLLTSNLGSNNEPGPLNALQLEHEAMTFETGSPSLADLQRDFAWGIVRAMGHKYIDNDKTGRGGYLINKAVGAMQLADGTVEKIASALCGLIPEAGAAVCAILEEGVDIAWNQVLIPRIEGLITTTLHDEFDRAWTAARNGSSSEAFDFLPKGDAIMTWMDGELIDNLTEDHLKDILEKLGGYNDSVYALGQAAANGI